jgi:large repetitive protein
MRPTPSIIFASVTLLLLGCSDSTGPSEGGPSFESPRPQPSEAASLQVDPRQATIRAGDTFQFTTTYSGDPALMGGTGGVIWYSSDEAVATVLPGGLVRGVRGGQARIVAVWAGYQASALITVVGAWKKDDSPAVCVKLPSAQRHPSDHC